MNIEVNFVLITTPQNTATQATMYFRADISYDTVNNIAATDAIRTLFANVSVIFDLIPDVKSIRIMSVPSTSNASSVIFYREINQSLQMKLARE